MEMIVLIEITNTEILNSFERHKFDVVFCTIKAPLYFWTELLAVDSVTINLFVLLKEACNKEFTMEDFSHEYLSNGWDYDEDGNNMVPFYNNEYGNSSMEVLGFVIDCLNCYRVNYLTTGDDKWLQYIIQLLPTSYYVTKKSSFNYETLKLICSKKHRLPEWIDFITWYNNLFEMRGEEDGKI